RVEAGGDIWLYGGGNLFARLLEWELVDTVEPAFMPILLGGGVPFLPSPAVRRRLELVRHQTSTSGVVPLDDAVRQERDAPRPAVPQLDASGVGSERIACVRAHSEASGWS